MRAIVLALTALLLSAGLPAQSPVPRPATEFTITRPDGTRTLLSSFQGKVVVIQFLATTCPHCQRLSQALNALGSQLGSDVQMIGIAFDDAGAAGTKGYVDKLNIGFPVGYADRQAAFGFLGLNETQRIGVPQVVVIDRQGRVRAQTDALGGGELGDPALLGQLITDLLREPAAAALPAANIPAAAGARVSAAARPAAAITRAANTRSTAAVRPAAAIHQEN